MSKLEDKVNEILGVESKAPVEKKEFKTYNPTTDTDE